MAGQEEVFVTFDFRIAWTNRTTYISKTMSKFMIRKKALQTENLINICCH